MHTFLFRGQPLAFPKPNADLMKKGAGKKKSGGMGPHSHSLVLGLEDKHPASLLSNDCAAKSKRVAA